MVLDTFGSILYNFFTQFVYLLLNVDALDHLGIGHELLPTDDIRTHEQRSARQRQRDKKRTAIGLISSRKHGVKASRMRDCAKQLTHANCISVEGWRKRQRLKERKKNANKLSNQTHSAKTNGSQQKSTNNRQSDLRLKRPCLPHANHVPRPEAGQTVIHAVRIVYQRSGRQSSTMHQREAKGDRRVKVPNQNQYSTIRAVRVKWSEGGVHRRVHLACKSN